ncbi:MAG: Anti-anti-sigma regulatory factor (antagonist of anti-sigma factor) [Verrucomicrobia bacterium]|jgi:anti-anti-sigma regulatory factor|nr:MAG: Anti-anti-sigma regulatory factor (antagonist of anti-sigma factor) [Verrucomicrobiota bacterium]
MNPSLAPTAMLAALLGGVVWVRIQCKGSVDCSRDLRQFVDLMVAQGQPKIVIDLGSCPGMDSTFMGTLAGMALRLRQVQGGCLDIVNPGDRNLQSLHELGLDRILNVDSSGSLWARERQMLEEQPQEPVPAAPIDPQSRRVTVTEAHETLCQVHRENIPRFRNVLEILRQSLAE